MGRKKVAISGQLADIDLRLLKVFKAVADAGGFTAAEIRLNLANSTISNYISDLETRLDMRLCDRGRGGFSLTEHGKVVYSATLDLLDAIDQFGQRVNHSHNRIVGHLHLGFAEHMLGVHNSRIVDAMRSFAEQAPDVRLQISTMGSDEITTAVLDKKVDIGITVLPQNHLELDTLTLFEEDMLLYCAERHPLYNRESASISPKELQQYNFVESPRLMPGRETHPDIKLWNKPAKAHHQEARATLILSGNYLGILPRHLVRNWGLANQMKPLLIDTYSYTNTFKAIRRKKHSNQTISTLFYKCLQESISGI